MMDERQKDVIWYCIPAADWNEALPLGNGRLGAMVYGGAYDECISINEDTLWSGYPVTRTTQQSMKNTFMDASQLTKEGHFAQAQELLEKKMSGLWTQAYMPLCDLCMHSRVSSQ